MAHKYKEIEQYINANNLLKSIELFCEKAVKSKGHLIPFIENKECHNALIDNDLVKVYNHLSTESYQIDWNPYLAYGIYYFVLELLNLSSPNNSKELCEVDKRIYEFRESNKEYRSARIKLVTAARRFLLIEANFRYGEDFSAYLDYHREHVFDATYALEKAFPFCELLPAAVENIVTFKDSETSIGIRFYKIINEKLRSDIDLLKLYQKHFIPNGDINLQGHIYSISYDLHSDRTLFEKGKNIEALLFANTLITLKSETDFIKSFSLAKSSSHRQPYLSMRCYVSLLNSEFLLIERDNLIKKIEEVLIKTESDIFGHCLHALTWCKIDCDFMDELIFKLMKKNNSKYLPYLNILEHYLQFTNRKKSKLDVFIELCGFFENKNNTHSFSSFIYSLSDEEYQELITKLLNHDNYKMHFIYKEVSHIKLDDEVLSSKVLNTLELNDIEYIANKIIAHVVGHQHLSSLTFSLLGYTKDIDFVDDLVKDIFMNYILFNYRSPIKFLERQVKQGNKREKKVAKSILAEDNEFWKLKGEIPYLKELELSSEAFENFNKALAKSSSKINQDRPKKFSILDIATTHELKCGNRFMFRRDDGSYGVSDGMKEISHSFELPIGGTYDPIGQAKIRWQTINYKRKIK